MGTVITEAQTEILQAYLNGTKHQRSPQVTGRLLDAGYLEPRPGVTVFETNLRITRKGIDALLATAGTRANPARINVVSAFHTSCPRCENIIDCGVDDTEVECPDCGRTFHTDFDSQNCGL